MMSRGFFGVAVYQPKTAVNVGTLWRTADLMGASFFCTIGRRYKTQASDVFKSTKHTPLFEYRTWEDFKANAPRDCRLIAIEMTPTARDLASFCHPERGLYVVGAEDNGLPERVISQCHDVVRLRGERSLNVATAGSIVLYHREGLR